MTTLTRGVATPADDEAVFMNFDAPEGELGWDVVIAPKNEICPGFTDQLFSRRIEPERKIVG
jgi:hypothetical protein